VTRHVARDRTMWDCTQAKAGLVEEAFAVFEEMQRPPQSVQPNREGLNTLLNACARALPPWPAKVMAPQPLCTGSRSSKTHSLSANPAWRPRSDQHAHVQAWEVLDTLMPAAGVQPDEVSFNTLLVLYGNAQDMDGAYRSQPSPHAPLHPIPDELTSTTARVRHP